MKYFIFFTEKTEALEFETKPVRPRSVNIMTSKSQRHGNGLLFSHFLAPVVEQETSRRHSIDVYDKRNTW